MSKDYEVGYGLPPKKTRFKKGKSGNPKGRPKGARSLKTEVLEEANETMVISENGKTQRISKRRAIIKQLWNKAMRGDIRAAKIILELVERFQETGEEQNDLLKLGPADRLGIEKLKAIIAATPVSKPVAKKPSKTAQHDARSAR